MMKNLVQAPCYRCASPIVIDFEREDLVLLCALCDIELEAPLLDEAPEDDYPYSEEDYAHV